MTNIPMPLLMDMPIVQLKIAEMLDKFKRLENDRAYIEECLSVLDVITDWKYSTGPIFDKPPYSMEMMGYDGGRLLKKIYPSYYEARLKGAYSSGFIDGEHRITINPSKPKHMPLTVNYYKTFENTLFRTTTEQFSRGEPPSTKPPMLRAISETHFIEPSKQLNVGAGRGGAFSVLMYCYGANGLLETAHLSAKGFQTQDDHFFTYDDSGNLLMVTTPSKVETMRIKVWPKSKDWQVTSW